MRNLLYILLVLQILGAITGFFALLFQSILLCLIFTPFSLLSIVPTVAIINNIDAIEDLRYSLDRMRADIKRSGDTQQAEKVEENKAPSVDRKESARGAWECVKCGTVNKEGTNHCINCKADYSSFTNPTVSPYAKKKVSRWIKEK